MLTTTQFKRSMAVAVAITSLGAGSAVARPADETFVAPSSASAAAVQDRRSPDAIDAAARRAVPAPARHEGLGVAPARTTSPAPAVPVAQISQADDSGGIDPLSVAIGASALLVLLLVAAVLRSDHVRLPHVRPRAS